MIIVPNDTDMYHCVDIPKIEMLRERGEEWLRNNNKYEVILTVDETLPKSHEEKVK